LFAAPGPKLISWLPGIYIQRLTASLGFPQPRPRPRPRLVLIRDPISFITLMLILILIPIARLPCSSIQDECEKISLCDPIFVGPLAAPVLKRLKVAANNYRQIFAQHHHTPVFILFGVHWIALCRRRTAAQDFWLSYQRLGVYTHFPQPFMLFE